MAKDKAVDSAVLNAGLTSIADAIREKAGTTEALSFPAGMAAAIAGIETGGGSEGKNILVDSITLENGLTTTTPLLIDIEIPKDEMPIAYGIWEDITGLDVEDNGHTATKIHSLECRITKNKKSYDSFVVYSSSGSSTKKLASGTVNYTSKDYSNQAGYYGTMDISIAQKQIKLKTLENNGLYLNGRKYYYYLIWGE